MINYNKIWSSINGESKSSSVKTQIARQIPSKGVFPVFLATDFKKGIRLLYIKLDANHNIVIDNLPRFKGLEVSLAVTSIGKFRDEEFLKFTQSIPNTDNIFELVISDICDNILQIQNKQNLNITLKKIIGEWRLFFDKHENEILSIHAQKGLVGELYFLRDYLFQKYSHNESICYWTGTDKTHHDFQIIVNAVEIKTTSGKQHKKFTISSERQLDNNGFEHLYVVLYSINLHSNSPERSLPALIREIYNRIENDPIATFQFQIKLIKCGYNEGIADRYHTGFSLFDLKIFEVTDNFPKLLEEDLPNGVGDIKYSVVVSACKPFEIQTDILNLI